MKQNQGGNYIQTGQIPSTLPQTVNWGKIETYTQQMSKKPALKLSVRIIIAEQFFLMRKPSPNTSLIRAQNK